MSDYLIAVILGIVEGITEFLPISSTGHLILVNEWIKGFDGDFAKIFDVVIQLGAIFSVVIYFRKKLIPFGNPTQKEEALSIWRKIFVALLPALLIGGTLGKVIQKKLFNPTVVAIALVVGGILLILIERRKKEALIPKISDITYKTAFFIGLIQCLAMIPGTSRSAATILGAIMLGASRIAAAEFSFFLAIPTMAAASAYSLLKAGNALNGSNIIVLAIGFIVSFFTAWFVIAIFMRFISKHDFQLFGFYRIVLGIGVLLFI